MSRVNISSFETDTKTPTLATLYKLAAAYGVDVCDLLPRDAQGQLPANEEPDPAPAKKPDAPKKGKKK